MAKPALKLSELTPDEKFELIDELWSSISADDLVLSPEVETELDRRLDRMEVDGPVGVPWEEVRAAMTIAPSETFRQSAHVDEKALVARRWPNPGPAVGCDADRGHEHVDMRMPLEGPCPGVRDCESTDVSAEKTRIGTQGGERVEGRAEQHLNGERVRGRAYGDHLAWTPNSRYFLVEAWLAADTSEATQCVMIDVVLRKRAEFDVVKGARIRDFHFEGDCLLHRASEVDGYRDVGRALAQASTRWIGGGATIFREVGCR